MSRYTSKVPLQSAAEVFGFKLLKKYLRLIEAGATLTVQVSHGYDRPCCAYFCDLEPECEVGIYYGVIGLTRSVSKWEYIDAMKKLGLTFAADFAILDKPY